MDTNYLLHIIIIIYYLLFFIYFQSKNNTYMHLHQNKLEINFILQFNYYYVTIIINGILQLTTCALYIFEIFF